jgi:hypothetical protein
MDASPFIVLSEYIAPSGARIFIVRLNYKDAAPTTLGTGGGGVRQNFLTFSPFSGGRPQGLRF